MTELSSFTITLDITGICVMFCTFMAAVYFNYHRGVTAGMLKAHLFGIYETVEFLMDHSGLSGVNPETGQPASVKDLTIQIAMELDRKRSEQSASC